MHCIQWERDTKSIRPSCIVFADFSSQIIHETRNNLEQCFSNGGPRTPGGPRGWAKGSAQSFNFVFFPWKSMWNEMYEEQRKNTTLYILNISQNKFMSRIHIINSGTWLYFSLPLYVARSFTNANFGITGASEIFALDLCLMLICKQVYTCWRGKGPRMCRVLLGGPRTRNILEPLT
jgi:hypothetical protein